MRASIPGADDLEKAFDLRLQGKYEDGRRLLYKAAMANNPDALFELFFSFRHGGWGYERDRVVARKFLEDAFRAGSEFAEVIIRIGFYDGDHELLDGMSAEISENAFATKLIDPFSIAYFSLRDRYLPSSEHGPFVEELVAVATNHPNRFRRTYAQLFLWKYLARMERRLHWPQNDGEIQSSKWLMEAGRNGLAYAQRKFARLFHHSVEMAQSMTKHAAEQGCFQIYNKYADLLTRRGESYALAAHFRIAYLRRRERIINQGADASRFQNFYICVRVHDSFVAQWRRATLATLNKEKNTELTLDDWREDSHLKCLSVARLGGFFSEFFVYGQAFHNEPNLLKDMTWKSPSDLNCCLEIYLFSNACSRQAVIAMEVLRRKKRINLSKDACNLVGRVIWESRKNPVVWLK